MRHLLATVAAALLIGCTPAVPYRTDLTSSTGNAPSPTCVDPAARSASAQPDKSTHEPVVQGELHADLYFVEFDDQGLLYPQGSKFGQASCQIDAVMADLESIAKNDGLSILVYVHGWKHNAQASDRDVMEFRRLLVDAALVEKAKEEKLQARAHRVVGVFVSWRGKSIDLPEPFISSSFWDRKNTAEHVAQGESRTLFARLRAFQTAQNSLNPVSGASRSKVESEKLAPEERRVLVILMGHSFGGLILYNSVAQSLLNSLYEAAPDETGKKVLPRFADMIIIANPAFEALRYTPLHRAAAASTFNEYQTPIFVSITSSADQATRLAFPLGRYISTIFQKHASDEEREANRNTMGHVDSYITHDLSRNPAEVCRGWVAPEKGQLPTREQARMNLGLEIENAKQFFANLPAKPEADWKRQFCGDTLLQHRAGHPYSPIWNIRTNGDLVPDHSEITQPVFISFVRQLYHDVVLAAFLKQ